MLKVFNAIILSFLYIILFPSTILAGSIVNTGLGPINGDPAQLVNDVLRIAIGAAGGVAFLLIIYGGFKLAFSSGDPKAIQDAREVITSAIVGLVIVVMSVFLLRLIGIDILGLPI